MDRSSRPGAHGVVLVVGAVIAQLLLEVTAGRILQAPNVLALVLTYLAINYGDVWSIEGAFWSGASLDLLLHQPIGCTSLGLLAGLLAGRLLLAAAPGENRLTLVLSGALAGLVCDIVFVLCASRPLFSGAGPGVGAIVARSAITLLTGFVFTTLFSAASALRSRRHNEAV